MHRALDDKKLIFTFAICFALLILCWALFPQIRLTFFAPCLVVACYQSSLRKGVWIAFSCGLLLDLLSADTHFGLNALDYSITMPLLYSQRRNFFADSVSTLPIMTFFFSAISSLIMAILLYSIEMRSIFSWSWIFTDVICMSALDAVYAFACFVLPAFIFAKPLRRGKDYFA